MIKKIIFASLFLSVFSNAYAEQAITQGNYKIHYSAFPSTALSAEMAKLYQLKRSRYRGILNITPQILADQRTSGIKASINGRARNLLGNTKEFDFKEIIEGQVIYYIAEFRYSNEEVLNFSLSIKPEINNKKGGEKPASIKPIEIKFTKKFFTN